MVLAVISAWTGWAQEAAGSKPLKLSFVCQASNDLYQVMSATGAYSRYDEPMEAVRAAGEGSAVLILADQYPAKTTVVAPSVFDEAVKKKLRLYIEYPSALPGVDVGTPKADRLLRGVVTSEIFGKELLPMRIVTINGCSFVPVKAENPHMALAKVAGVDTAVFGLANTPSAPLLFEHDHVLVATTKLSQFVTGRYMPEEAWRTIWQTILGRLQPGAAIPELKWTATVRPRFGRDEPLPPDIETQALRRSVQWIMSNSRILRHPQWPKQALDWALRYNTVRDMPGADWPTGDGSLGLVEGFSSTIRADGSQLMRYAVRNDCMGEVAMLLALDAAVSNRRDGNKVAAHLLDYIFGDSGLAIGPRADPKNPGYGLIGWEVDQPYKYWGDDNARALLGMLAVSSLQRESRWSDGIARNLLANLRTSGINGLRPNYISQAGLEKVGWRYYWQQNRANNTTHMTAWLLACFCWAYEKTRFEPFLTRAEAGCRTLMTAYPKWEYNNGSGSFELARALLPLAWLVRVQDTPEHREWLQRIARDLLALQDDSGAIREILAPGNSKWSVNSNARYGVCETSLIQDNSDTVADMLYTCNFALIGLHEAAAATGDRTYADAEEKLVKFLCRIQIRSEAHPELDGAWYRAFNFGNWQYWASNADIEWGPWCTETGWTQPWIAGTLALRQMKTSLWDVAKQAPVSKNFDQLRREMIPDEALQAIAPVNIRHAAAGKAVTLAAAADARYSAGKLTDGLLGGNDFQEPGWLGFEGRDMEATIDLGVPTAIRGLSAGFLSCPANGIYLPPQVEFSISDDGITFRPAAKVKASRPPSGVTSIRMEIATGPLDLRARYVRVHASSLGPIPVGQPGAQKPSWLFVDELLLNPSEEKQEK